MGRLLESAFQKEVIDEIKIMFPGCIAIKNDSSYIQGFPDWTILWKDKWAVLEAKRDLNSSYQPNQEYYISELNKMSFARMICPENKEEVLNELYTAFRA